MSRSTLIGQDRSTGELKDISQVSSGLECECVCPGCGDRLVAKKGSQVVHHFAHYSEAVSRGCVETAVHLLGKKILTELNPLPLPDFVPDLPVATTHNGVQFKPDIRFAVPTVAVMHAQEEVRLGSFQPDVLLTISVSEVSLPLALEVAVTHYVEADKFEKVKGSDLSMVEIELGMLVGKDLSLAEFRAAVLEQLKKAYWIWMDQSMRQLLSISVKDALADATQNIDREATQAFESLIANIKQRLSITLPEIDWLALCQSSGQADNVAVVAKRTWSYTRDATLVGTNSLPDGIELVLSSNPSVPRLHAHFLRPCEECKARSYLLFDGAEQVLVWGHNRRAQAHVRALIEKRKELALWTKSLVEQRDVRFDKEVGQLRSLALKAIERCRNEIKGDIKSLFDGQNRSVEIDFKIWQAIVLEVIVNLKTEFTAAEVVGAFTKLAPRASKRQIKIAEVSEYLRDERLMPDQYGHETYEKVITRYLGELVARNILIRQKNTFSICL